MNRIVETSLQGKSSLTPVQRDIRRYLEDPAIRQGVRQQLEAIQAEVTTGISEAGRLANMSEAQVRYSEAKGLLSPKRSLPDASQSEKPPDSVSAPSRGQRRYSISELSRLVIIGKLLDGHFNLADIGSFLQTMTDYIEEITSGPMLLHSEQLEIAEATVFRRFLVPRVLYYVLWLLIENTLDRTIGVYLPVREDIHQLAAIDELAVDTVGELESLGQSLVGWYTPGKPFIALLQERPTLDASASLEVFALQERFATLYASERERAKKKGRQAHLPLGVHIALDSSLDSLLATADASIELRKLRAAKARETPIDLSSGLPNIQDEPADPRLAALRLLWLLQQPSTTSENPGDKSLSASSRSFPSLWHIRPESSNSMVYSSSEFVTPLLGDRQLNYLLEAVIQLKSDAWAFACLSLPISELEPVQRREMRIEAQSSHSPHKLGVTTVSADPQQSLVVRAYQSGQIIARPRIVEGDATIAFQEIEEARSAIAIPVEGYKHEILGALYVASHEEDAFDEHDHLLLRIMGKLIGELLFSYRVRQLNRAQITAITLHPDNVDTYLGVFRSENHFIRDFEALLQWLLNPASKSESFQTLSLIAVDIEGQGQRISAYGENLAHNLVLEVGKRIREQMRILHSEPRNIRIYRIIGDRFLILLRNVETEQTRRYAYELREALRGSYLLANGASESAAVRIGTITYDRGTLLRLDAGWQRGQRPSDPRTGRLGDAQSAAHVATPIDKQQAKDARSRMKEQAAQIRASVAQTLDEALAYAKHSGREIGPENIIAWDNDTRRFIPWALQTQSESNVTELIKQLASASPNSQEGLLYKMLMSVAANNSNGSGK